MAINYFHKLRHYFIPHESNNYKAKSLHNISIVYYICLVLAFQTLTGFVRTARPQILGYATDVSVEKLYNLVNQKRTEAGLQPLGPSVELSTAATQKATDMFDKNYWAHISPTGTTPWKFILDAKYDYLYAGENLAKDFDRSQDVVEAWLNSPTHRANIMKPEYTDIGLAVMNGKLNGVETTLVVQEFGTRKNLAGTGTVKNIPQAEISPAPQTVSQNEKIVGQTEQAKFPLSSFRPSKSFSLLLSEILLVVLFIDSIYIWKTRTTRISGRSFAHLIFIVALIGAMGFTGVGVIL